MSYIIILLLLLVVLFIFKKWEKKNNRNNELARNLIRKIYLDFMLNKKPSKLKSSYNYIYYAFCDGTYIKYEDRKIFTYQSNSGRYKFRLDDYNDLRLITQIELIEFVIRKQTAERYYNYGYTNNSTVFESKDTIKYNKLVNVFKLRKQQLLSMDKTDKDYQSLKNEFLVLKNKLTELKKKL